MLKHALFLLLGFAMLPPIGFAQNIVPVIGPPTEPLTAGNHVVVPIYYRNTGSQTVTVALPARLMCHLTWNQQTREVESVRIDPADEDVVRVEPNQHAVARYRLLVAPDIHGEVLMVMPEISTTGLMLTIGPQSAEAADGFSWRSHSSDKPMNTLIGLYQPYARNISYYKPMYFLVGTEPEDSKFQISFKYRFFSPEKPLAKRYPWVQGFYLGYTQTSYWDLSSDSAPFEDTSYMPELFYLSPRLKTPFSSLDGMFLKAGIQHESNGRGGSMSRSTNFAYISPIFIYYNEQTCYGLKIAPKFWFYFSNEDENNPDIDEYRGYFDLGITAGKADGLVVDSHFQWASQGPSVQLDLTYPLHTLFLNHLDLYLHLNYTNTLAERLINYTDREQAVRIGIAIVR